MTSAFRKYACVLALLSLVLLILPSAFAQETTAGLQGTVKDPTGAVVSKATVEVTSPALIGVKKLDTDAGGYYRFANLPPGTYALIVTAKGFRSYKQTGIDMAVGKLPTIDITLQVGAVAETVEVSGQAPLVDVAQSRVQVNVTEEILSGIPKGRSFQSVIAFAPGARYEPLQTCQNCVQGFQVDGASTSENSYLVEGQETTAIRSGQISTNVPMEFIQEVQVKSSGFEAEYGGALGGVVNVIQKRGSNTWHGSVVTHYQGDAFNSAPNREIRYVPNTTTAAGRKDQPFEFFQPKKDHYRIVEPGFEVGGYLVKDRLWTFTSFVPRIERRTREVKWNYNPGGGVTPITTLKTFPYQDDTFFSLARVDFLATQKIRVYGAWQYGYERVLGDVRPGPDSPYYVSGNKDQFNSDSTQNPDNFFSGMGTVYPNRIYNLGADITLTPSIVATTRYGYSLYDTGQRGRPTSGTRYQYLDTNYPYAANAPYQANVTDPFTGGTYGDIAGFTTAASSFFGPSNFSNMPANLVTDRDKYTRQSLNQDVAIFRKTSFGTHNFKAGYAFNRMENDPKRTFKDVYFILGFGTAYNVLPVNQANCAAIRAENTVRYGNAGTDSDTACIGRYGTFNIGTTVENYQAASSYNHSLYVQDAWNVGHGLTLNLGVRFDKETLPAYNSALSNSFKGISFGFFDKVAPRLGGSWDVMGNGKVKVYGSYGWFYDIMKYSLPRGSFGGDYWHDCVYTLDTTDLSQIRPTRTNGFLCPPTGPASGIPASVGRFLENQDFRSPSNDPNNYLIDPNLKPMRQHEYVAGVDWSLTPSLAFEARYSRKRLDRTIEDAGLQTAAGETFYIVNVGEGIHKQPLPTTECVGCPTQPKPVRRYDGLEFRLTRRASASWFGTLSYTYSRLYGNYAGLASTDQSDGRSNVFAGRTDPNNNRSFDEPNMQFDAHGKLIDGPLGTDRPHTLKAFGYYRLKWWKMETLIGGTQQAFSGTPISSYTSAAFAPQFLEGRGKFVELTRQADGTIVASKISDRRTPSYTQTDLNLVHEMHVSKSNENLKLGFEANVLNLFNQHSVVNVYANVVRTGTLLPNYGGIPAASVSQIDYHALMTGYNYVAALNGKNADGTPADNTARTLNSRYGQPSLWQDGRGLRFKVKFTF